MFPQHCSVNHQKHPCPNQQYDVYIDDVRAFSTSWDTHLVLLDTILFHLNDKTMASQSAHSSVSGPSKNLTGLVIGSPHVAANLGKRKLMKSYTWTIHAPQLIFTASLDVSIFTRTCGPAVPALSTPHRLDTPLTGLTTCDMHLSK